MSQLLLARTPSRVREPPELRFELRVVVRYTRVCFRAGMAYTYRYPAVHIEARLATLLC